MENVNGLSLDLIIHPGETIREVIDDRDINQEELAVRTGFSPKHISEVLRGKKSISSNFALNLEYALDIPSSFWMNLQSIYDKEILEFEKMNEVDTGELIVLDELKEIVDFCESKKIVNSSSKKAIKVLNMRRFFNLNNLQCIPNLPFQKVAFRGSNKAKLNIYVLYAWQKICQYYTEDIKLDNELDVNKLKNRFFDIKRTMFLEPNEMIKSLKGIFSECGIVFDVVKHFKGAPVQGFIKKEKNKIILCMTIRQSFSDIFWFTLFHEIGHIVNDDCEDKFIDYSFVDSDIEKRANEFSRNVLIDEDEYAKFLKTTSLTYENIKEFGQKQNVIPGIVIGRIQNDTGDYSFMAKYKERYKWSN